MNLTINVSFKPVHIEGQKRIILEGGLVNPKKMTGKVGIRAHHFISHLFHNTIKINIVNKETSKTETIYLNKKSAIQWINAQTNDNTKILSNNINNQNIINRINTIVSKNIDWSQFPDFHKGKPSNASLQPLFDRFKGFFINIYWKVALSSWTLFRFRFKLVPSEKTRFSAAQTRANHIFHKARRECRHIKNF